MKKMNIYLNNYSKQIAVYALIISTLFTLVAGWLGVEMKSMHCFVASAFTFILTICLFIPFTEFLDSFSKVAPLSVEDMDYDTDIIYKLQELQNRKSSV